VIIEPQVLIPLVCSDHEVACVSATIKEAVATATSQIDDFEEQVKYSLGLPFVLTYRIGAAIEGERLSQSDVLYKLLRNKGVFGISLAACLR
jgi:hypothetical protein